MWYNDYVGLPFKEGGRDNGEYDCWGLVRAVLSEQVNIQLPRLDNLRFNKNTDRRKLIREINDYANAIDGWRQLTLDGNYDTYDICWLRNGGPIHWGVMVSNKLFLHVERGCDSVIERIDSPQWHNKVRGMFRHESR